MYEPNAGENGQEVRLAYRMPVFHSEADAGRLSQVFWRGRRLVLLSVMAGAAIAGLCLRVLPPQYESTARILIGKPGVRPSSDVPQPLGSTSNNYVQTQASLIMTREIVGVAMNDPNVLALPTLRDRVGELVRSLSVVVGRGTDLVSISARSPYPEEPAAFVNAVVRAYIRWHEANKQIGTADLLKDLNAQLENRLGELQAKRKEQMLFEQRHPEVVEAIRGGIVSKTLELLRQDLATARLNVIQQDSFQKGLSRLAAEPERFRQYVQNPPLAGMPLAGDGERAALTTALYETRLLLDDAAVGRTMRGTDVALLKKKQALLEKRLGELDKGFVEGQIALAQAVAEDAAAREQELTKRYEAELAKVQSVGGLDAEYAFLTSECSLMENLCNNLLTQISNLDLNARLEGQNTYVLEQAVPALEPVWPQPVAVFGIGLVAAVMVGVGLAFLRDWIDQSVRSADEITAILGVPVLGAVPSVSQRKLAARRLRLRFDSNSRESEAYRSIRTSLCLGVSREHARTILVTSPGPMEGKTTLVSNLGIAMARAGQKTLILDADLRKPMQHHIFRVDQHGPGLVEVLTGTASLEDAIQHTEVPQLDVLPGGQRTARPAELLDSPAFGSVLERLKTRYDRILIDSSPVGVVTDAQIIASRCGLTLLVLRANKSSRLLTQRAGGALLAVGARVAGVVVNGVSRKDSKYSRHNILSSYERGYGSGNGKAAHNELPPGTGHALGHREAVSSQPE